MRSAAWLLGNRRGADGKYDAPEFQAIFDELEKQPKPTDQKEH